MNMLSKDTAVALFAAVAAGVAIKYIVGFALRKKKEYRVVGKVGQIWVYPFKSLRGIKVDEAEVTPLGLKWNGLTDRAWMCANAKGAFLTQKQCPTMAMIEPHRVGDEIELRAPGMQPIRIPLDPEPTSENMTKSVFEYQTVESVDLGDEVAQWLSQYLGRDGIRLHYSAPSLEKRDSSNAKKDWVNPAKKGDLCAFPNYCSFMVLSSAALTVLNEKLENPVPITNFRANIIVDDCEPFAEDAWAYTRIGDSVIRALHACTRCPLITVDQDKGVKDKNSEPLNTLKTFRKRAPYGEKATFGSYHAFEKPGVIRVGDPIYAIDA